MKAVPARAGCRMKACLVDGRPLSTSRKRTTSSSSRRSCPTSEGGRQVELEDGVLTVEGERTKEKEEKGKRFHKVERAREMCATSRCRPKLTGHT